MESNDNGNSGIIYVPQTNGIITATGEEDVHSFLVQAQEGDLVLDFVNDRVRALRVQGDVNNLVLAVTAFVRRTLATKPHVGSPDDPVHNDGGYLTDLVREQVPPDEVFNHSMYVGDEGLRAYSGIRCVPKAFSPEEYRDMGRETALKKYRQAARALPPKSILRDNIATLTGNLYTAAVVVSNFVGAEPPPPPARRTASA